MKIELSLLNAVRFETGESTRLHVCTRDVDPQNALLIRPDVGPFLHLKRNDPLVDTYPLTDGATLYGAGRSEITCFVFGLANSENYLATAGTSTPDLPEDLDLTTGFRMSLFLRPDALPADITLIAGIPGRFGLYQQNDALKLVLVSETTTVEAVCTAKLTLGAWQLVEVQWGGETLLDGVPMWFVNGVPAYDGSAALIDPLTELAGDRFNLAHDHTQTTYWQGAIRELELSEETIWIDDEALTKERFYARAMRLLTARGVRRARRPSCTCAAPRTRVRAASHSYSAGSAWRAARRRSRCSAAWGRRGSAWAVCCTR